MKRKLKSSRWKEKLVLLASIRFHKKTNVSFPWAYMISQVFLLNGTFLKLPATDFFNQIK